MTSIDNASAYSLDRPPHVPAFSLAVRVGLVAVIAALSAACLIFDWPFAGIGLMQPTMLALGFALIQFVIDVPFRGLLPRTTVVAAFVLMSALAWLSWYTGGSSLSQETVDTLWKVTTVGIMGTLLGFGVWNAPYQNFHAKIAAIPMMLIVIFAFVGSSFWTMAYSLTDAKIFPVYKYVGLKQYYRLFSVDIWQIAVHNAIIYLVLGTLGAFIGGFLLAVFMDQKIRLEGLFRTIYLYPFALSFIVTGHVWAWIFSPAYGLERSIRQMGWESFNFSWIAQQDMAIYCVVIAGLWQGTGLVMALMLAGLRGIDDEIWKAARVDGIPKWRTYLQIVIPMMRPVLVTTFVIVASGAVRVYDIVVALTDGGPGISTTVPAQYVYKYLFGGSIGQGLAASTVMLGASAVILIPWVYVEFVRNKQVR
jgi:glucose/mannose transport system permease protein